MESTFTIRIKDSSVIEELFTIANSKQKEEECDRYDASYRPANPNTCSQFGTWSNELGSCECQEGYMGDMCQLEAGDLEAHKAATAQAIA